MTLSSNWQEVEQQTASFNVQYDTLRNELDKKVDETKALGEQCLATVERLEGEKSARLAAEEEARRNKKVFTDINAKHGNNEYVANSGILEFYKQIL